MEDGHPARLCRDPEQTGEDARPPSNAKKQPLKRLLTRNEIQLDFGGGRVIGGHIFPLPDRQRSCIHKNGIASDG
jgi:hypothetical protein